jgi:rhomboid family GlyGly-CTERM serine protease
MSDGRGSSWRVFLQLDGRRLWVFAAICMTLVVLESFGDQGRVLLRYDRAAIVAGEWWRLFSGHLMHLGWTHLELNLAGLALLWALFFGDYSPGRWVWILALSVLSIDTGFFLDRSLQWYVGLSGLLHGVLAAGTLAHWRWRRPDAWILAVFLIGKLTWEQMMGPMPFSAHSAGGPVLVDAHLYGAVGGLAAALSARIVHE